MSSAIQRRDKKTGGNHEQRYHAPRRVALGVSAAALAATGASAQSASPSRLPMLPPRRFRSKRAQACACCGRCVSSRPTRTCSAPMRRSSPQKTGVEVKVDFVGWEDINQQTAVTSNSGAGPDIIIGFSRRAAHLCRQADRTDRCRRLSRQALWRLAVPRAEIRQAQQEQRLDRIAVRRQRRPAGVSQIDASGGRLRQGAGRSCRLPRPLPEAAKGRQARRLRARQRGRRRQRFCELAVVVAQRLAARRGRQCHHQQQGDDRRAEISQGIVPDLHRRHAVMERRQQQPRLFGAAISR